MVGPIGHARRARRSRLSSSRYSSIISLAIISAARSSNSDGDGVGNNSDAFPQDPEETTDTDGDGVGDNSDADPDDPEVRNPADLEINVTDRAIYVLAASLLFMAVVLLVVNRKKRPPQVVGASEVFDSDSIWNES